MDPEIKRCHRTIVKVWSFMHVILEDSSNHLGDSPKEIDTWWDKVMAGIQEAIDAAEPESRKFIQELMVPVGHEVNRIVNRRRNNA